MKHKNEKGITLVALIVIIVILIVITAVIVAFVVNNKNSDQSNNTIENNISNNNEQNTQSTEYYSVLDHLPEFSETQKDPATVLWTSGLPINANPLTYQNGAYVAGLRYANNSRDSEDISLSADEISNIRINGDNANVSKYSSSSEPTDIYFCTLTIKNSEGNKFAYIPICKELQPEMWNIDYCENTDLTLGEVFENGLYIAKSSVFNFADEQGIELNTDSSTQERLNVLINKFENPSGLYWRNGNECITEGLDEYITFEEFKNGNRDNTEKRTKTYYLVWDYGDCYIAASMYENPKASSGDSAFQTNINEVYLFQKVDDYAAFRNDSPYNSLTDGYIGYGQAPGQLRFKGATLSATE